MLGEASESLHAGLAADLLSANVDLVFTAGNAMRHLYESLPLRYRGDHAKTADQQRERLGANQVRSDDLMRRIDLHAIADEVQQGRRVDHITSHLGTLGGPTPSL